MPGREPLPEGTSIADVIAAVQAAWQAGAHVAAADLVERYLDAEPPHSVCFRCAGTFPASGLSEFRPRAVPSLRLCDECWRTLGHLQHGQLGPAITLGQGLGDRYRDHMLAWWCAADAVGTPNGLEVSGDKRYESKTTMAKPPAKQDMFGIGPGDVPDDGDDEDGAPPYVILQIVPAEGWTAVFRDPSIGNMPTRTLGVAGFALVEVVVPDPAAPPGLPIRAMRPMVANEHGEIEDAAMFEDFVCVVPPGGDREATIEYAIAHPPPTDDGDE
jgi:hypothetical protein